MDEIPSYIVRDAAATLRESKCVKWRCVDIEVFEVTMK